MKGKHTLIPLFLTLLLIVLGGAMPRLFSAFQDRRLEAEVFTRQIENVELAPVDQQSIYTALSLFSQQSNVMNLTTGNRTTAEQAKAAAWDVLSALGADGLLPVEGDDPPESEAVALLAICDATPIVFWQVTFGSPSGLSYAVLIDDATSEMIAFALSDVQTIDYMELQRTSTPEACRQRAAGWADFFKTYYQFDEVELEELYNGGVMGDFLLHCEKQSGETAVSLVLPLYIRAQQLIWNI